LPGPGERPGLLAAALVMAGGLPGMERDDRLESGPAVVAAALWRSHGYGRSCALPFWSAPVSRIDALARHGGGDFERGYLDCVAEAAQRGARALARLHRAARKIAALPGSARSRLQAAGASRCASRWSPGAGSQAGSRFPPARRSTLPPGSSRPACCVR
jgi:hypothetical protein